jgi:hypothetical protein
LPCDVASIWFNVRQVVGSIAPVEAVVVGTAAIPIAAIKIGIATVKSEAAAISEAASESEAVSKSAVESESTTAEATSMKAAAEATSMESPAAKAAARKCFVVRSHHQSSDGKRGNERRRDFGRHNAFSFSLDDGGKNEELLPRGEDLVRPIAIPPIAKKICPSSRARSLI